MNFAPIDRVIVYLLLSVSIGLTGKRYVGSVSHFLVVGREHGLYSFVIGRFRQLKLMTVPEYFEVKL